MKMQRVRWEDWDAVRCWAGDCELIVGTSAGPRILSVRRGTGPNLLYRDPKDFRVGDWRLYGGHRFTVAPESPASYTPDNEPCTVEATGLQLRVAAPCGPDGTRRALVIGASADGAGFEVRHVLENQGRRDWHGALWAITCVPQAGRVMAPRTHPHVHFWPGTAREHWEIAPEYIAVTPNGLRGKAGWHSDAGWVASVQRDGTLVVHCPEAPRRAACVDDGCNVEVFVCSDYAELETLSGKITLPPAGHATHLQHWRILPPTPVPRDCFAIAT